MQLHYQPMQESDCAACARIYKNRGHLNGMDENELAAAWQLLLQSKAGQSIVVIRGNPPSETVAAFGMSAFITDAFLRRIKTSPSPGVLPALLAGLQNGESPVLSLPQIRCANSGSGLNLLIWNGHAQPFRGELENFAVLELLFEAFMNCHAGYEFSEMIGEAYGEEGRAMLTGGVKLLTDYTEHYESRGLPLPPPDQRSYLVGISREEALSEFGNHFMPFFLYAPPRFFFRAGEQEMLGRALLGGTNEQLARDLHITPTAVKKRWERVYERVYAADPALLSEDGTEKTDGRRGTEKKERFLAYLRRHPEELRPLLPPRRG